METIRMMLLKS